MSYSRGEAQGKRRRAIVAVAAVLFGASYATFGVWDAHALLAGRQGDRIVWEFSNLETNASEAEVLRESISRELSKTAKQRLVELSSLKPADVGDQSWIAEVKRDVGRQLTQDFTGDQELSDKGDLSPDQILPRFFTEALSAFNWNEISSGTELSSEKALLDPPDVQKSRDSAAATIDDLDQNSLAHSAAEERTQAGEREKAAQWLEARVGKGDSLSVMFQRMGISARLLHNILASGTEAKQLAQLNPGELLRIQLDSEGEVAKLVLERNALRSLHVIASGDGFEASLSNKPVETRQTQLTGVITDSLYQSAKRMGMKDKMIMELSEIFGWDIDFALDIKRGDSFAVVFEERYVDGERYSTGNILAAEFINNGKAFRAIRFEDEAGRAEYYTPEGQGMRKAFLRAPVDFRRISSKFSPARYHPVLGKKRPHRGVDYAAAEGTPIVAAGSGTISFRGKKGGYGNTVVIDHDGKHTTLYAHMSRFHKGLSEGDRVKQGDVIGYVGSSGLATGPHLHYEFRVDNVHVDPLKAKMTQTVALRGKDRATFASISRPLVAQLDIISSSRLASSD